MQEMPRHSNLFEKTDIGGQASRYFAGSVVQTLTGLELPLSAHFNTYDLQIDNSLFEATEHLIPSVVDRIGADNLVTALRTAEHIKEGAVVDGSMEDFARHELDDLLTVFGSFGITDAVHATLLVPASLSQPEALAVTTNPRTLATIRHYASDPQNASGVAETGRLAYDSDASTLATTSTPVEGQGCPLVHGSGRIMDRFFRGVSSFVITHATTPDGSLHWQP